MPSAYVEKLARKHNIPLDEAERRWNKAKRSAADQGQTDNYALVMGIFQTMMGERAALTLKVMARLIATAQLSLADAERVVTRVLVAQKLHPQLLKSDSAGSLYRLYYSLKAPVRVAQASELVGYLEASLPGRKVYLSYAGGKDLGLVVEVTALGLVK